MGNKEPAGHWSSFHSPGHALYMSSLRDQRLLTCLYQVCSQVIFVVVEESMLGISFTLHPSFVSVCAPTPRAADKAQSFIHVKQDLFHWATPCNQSYSPLLELLPESMSEPQSPTLNLFAPRWFGRILFFFHWTDFFDCNFPESLFLHECSLLCWSLPFEIRARRFSVGFSAKSGSRVMIHMRQEGSLVHQESVASAGSNLYILILGSLFLTYLSGIQLWKFSWWQLLQ